MDRVRHGRLRGLAAAVAVLLALALCAGAAAPPYGNAAAANAAYGGGDKEAMLEYLTAAGEDLALIGKLLKDEDLGLTEEPTDSGEETTKEDIELYLGVLEDWASQLDSRMEAIKLREEPNNPDVAFFVAAEAYEFETLSGIIEEYIQVLEYSEVVLDMNEEMQFEDPGATDLETWYESINASITGMINKLSSADVPSFLENRNEGMIATLSDLNDTVLYTLSAVAYNDPVLISAGLYRLGMLMRSFEKLGEEFDQDMKDRTIKLWNDALRIQDENDGLADWVQKNIARLGGN